MMLAPPPCPRCGAPIHMPARFCNACGAPLFAHGPWPAFDTHGAGFSVVAVLISLLWFRINGVPIFPLGLVAATTIQLSHEMKKALEGMKLHPRETYEDVLERLLEDLQELNEQTKKEIEQAVRDIKAGKYRTHQQLKDELGF